MNSYAYLGSRWGGQAQAARDADQRWGNYAFANAQKASGLRVGRRQLSSQAAMNMMRQRDDAFRFGAQALGGLLR